MKKILCDKCGLGDTFYVEPHTVEVPSLGGLKKFKRELCGVCLVNLRHLVMDFLVIDQDAGSSNWADHQEELAAH